MAEQAIGAEFVPDDEIEKIKKVQQVADIIKQYREGTNYYLYPPGTKTLEYKQYELEKTKADRDYAIDKTKLALEALSGGSGGGQGSGGPKIGNTLSEKRQLLNYKLYWDILGRYAQNKLYGSSKVKQSPLYYALATALKDPKYVSQYLAGGADYESVIEAALRTIKGTSAEKYFSTPKGQQLKEAYRSAVAASKPFVTAEESELSGLFSELTPEAQAEIAKALKAKGGE